MSERIPTPVLVVDDESVALSLVTLLLKRIGFDDIDTACDGLVGHGMMTQKRYGLVISDWNMPEMTGLELLRAVRADDYLKRTPFILTSIDGSVERARLARLAGVSAFLLKPFSEPTLKAKLDEVL